MGKSCSKFCGIPKKTRYEKKEREEKNEKNHDKRNEKRQRTKLRIDKSERKKDYAQPTEADNSECFRNYAINNGIKTELEKGDEENMRQNNYIPPNNGNYDKKANGEALKDKEKNKTRKGGEKKRNEEKKKKRRRRRRKHKYWSDSSSSSSDDETGKTSKSRQKKVDKDGNVTYIRNKTTIGSSKISFKAAKNINIYNHGNINHSKPTEKPTSLFTTEYTRESAYRQEEDLLGQTRNSGQLVDLRGQENVQAVTECRSLVKCSEWVGQITFPRGHCTCFRVGSKYIMTALHSVREIVNTYNDFIPVNGKQASDFDSDLSVLSNGDVKIDFYYEIHNQTDVDNKKFTFKKIKTRRDIPFLDEETDVIVLELEEKPGQHFPPNFSNFGIPKFDKPFSFITHSKGDPKAFDKVNKMVDISDPSTVKDIEKFRKLSYDYVLKNGKDPSRYRCETPPYNTVDNKSRLLFHCVSEKGASGSPGVQTTPDGRVIVVTMLLHGYPDWYYDNECKTMKKEWSNAYTIEQGVNFASVYTAMRERNLNLCDEIFQVQEDGKAGGLNKTVKAVPPTDAH